MKKTIKITEFLTVILLFFIGCDKDFSIFGSDFLEDRNINFKTSTLSFQKATYNKKLEAFQSNGLYSNLLGVFNNTVYGQTINTLITQITQTTYTTDIDTNPVIDSVR